MPEYAAILKSRISDYGWIRFGVRVKIRGQGQGLICQSDGRAGFGVVESADGFVSWSVLPLRLTAAGHDFIDALRNREVWATLKASFKDASMGTLMTVSKELFNRALNKQPNKYFN
ncbi:DUF2513 domain-containing protein [Dickeya ananatis]|uniref:DUF2513 domain-containing protein n=1 Tax=Dickeya ananatis TaxID=3061286 RepID=UPI003EB9CF88